MRYTLHSIAFFYITHELIHFGVAIFLTYLFYKWFHSKRSTILCFAYSIFIDLDHLFDFFLYNKGISFNAFIFFTTPYFPNSGKAYVPLHGWEYAIILLTLSLFLRKYRDISIALSLAIIGHLLIDQFCYGMTPFKYFLIYRWWYGFGIEL